MAAGDEESKAGALSEAATLGASPSAPTDAAPIRERPGGRVGPYKLLQLIGEGGFGMVFLAEQEKPVARRVALKIIRLGMDTNQVVARFEQERQALAIMDHPGIAKVLDAGATETGRPFFVMEFCPGEPIDDFCDRNQLPLDARLKLFVQVCHAVQHAHGKGIIHRDIKPSNVLVAIQDDEPRARVIDFGIAKATAAKLTDRTLFTENRQLVGTPEYMSPEQAAGSLDIDTRTDVYSLGVLLYELLTGTTPFSGRNLRSVTSDELQRIIRDVDPPKPSTRISQAVDSLPDVAARRRIEPGKLNTAVRGELDWIVMRAMDKERSRRYETASGLAADIERFLSGEPVTAAPPSAAYRTRKFIRRNRGLVAAGALVAGALVLGIVGTSIGLISANRQRALARDSEAKAVQEASRAAAAEKDATSRLAESEATVKFLDDMLGAVDPAAQGKEVTVRAVLDRAAADVGAKFADRPVIAARLHDTIGRTYTGLGVYGKAKPHVREALKIRRRELGPEHPDTCAAVNSLAAFLIKAGENDEAETLLTEAIADHERLFGRKHPITLESIDTLGALYSGQNRPADALPLIKESLDARRAAGSPATEELVRSMNTLALVYADLSRYEDAEQLFEEAIAAEEKLTSADHPNCLEIRSNLAWMLYWAGCDDRAAKPDLNRQRLERARTLGEQVLQDRIRVLGEEHHQTLTSLSNLAIVYKRLGMRDQALEMSRRDAELSVRLLGEEHPDTIVSLSNYGNLLRDAGRRDEALPQLEKAVRLSRKVLPPDNPGTAYALGWYAGTLSELGRYGEAEAPLLEARSTIAKVMGEDHTIARQMARELANLYAEWDKAEPGQGYAAKSAQWREKAPAAPPASP